MYRIVAAVLALLAGSLPALAQESAVPDRRIVTSMGQDFYGGDIGSILETTFPKCREACFSNTSCKALTFNTRAGACFLKSGVERVEAFEGAISARILDVEEETRRIADRRRGEIGFIADSQVRMARELAAELGGRIAANDTDPDAVRALAREGEENGNLDYAAQNYAAVTTMTDSARDWRDLARVWAKMKPQRRADQRRFATDALSASINAYLRARNEESRASSLVTMARMLEKTGKGRQMIPALRLAQEIAPGDATQALLNRAISRYGFRVVDHRVDAEPAVARLCVSLSEPLAPAGVDYAPYVSVEAQPNLPVEADGNDLCVDGLEHGQRYSMMIRSGLPSEDGEILRDSARIEAYVKDRSPSVRFTGRAYVLPKSARASIPIVSVNVTEVELEIYRIGERSLVPLLREGKLDDLLSPRMASAIEEDTGEEVWKGKADVLTRVNADVTTALPIGQAVETFEPGIYAMVARVPGDDASWERKATQWFIVTDLGLQSMQGADGIHAFVRSLATAEPLAGAKVELVARNNQVLGTGTSDQAGYVAFDPGLTRGTGGNAPAMLSVEHAGDFAFLDLTGSGFDLSDRGVEGRAAPGPIDVHASTERGVYRPGEVVHMTALTRDARADAILDIPLTLIVTRPDGVEYHRALLRDQGAGGRAHSMRLGDGVPRGTWTARLHADPERPALAEMAFLVEDFVPEKIDYDLAAPDGMVDRETQVELALNVRYLYGAPGANLPVTGTVRLTAAQTLPGFEDFTFGLADENVSPVSESLETVETDANGDARLVLRLPDSNATTRPLEVKAIVEVKESSGRPVERTLERPLAPGKPMIGIRKLFDGQAPEGGTAGFEIVAVDAEGRQTAMEDVGWTLSRIDRNWQWYVVDGNWNWEATTSREKMANGTIRLPADGRARIDAPVEWGEYELKLVHLSGAPAAASVKFGAGWYTGGAETDTPDVLEVGLDKESYAVGETMELRLKPREAGKVLIAVVDNRLIEMKSVEVQAGETSVPLTVSPDWGPGAYVTATLIRPADAAAAEGPSRALGLAWAEVDPGERLLDVSFLTPETADPRGPLDASVRIAGLEPGEEAYVTVAAVDLGILNLTGFESPAPENRYYGQRALGMEFRDLYGKLIDGSLGTPGRLRSGGDANGGKLKSIPPVEELIAYFSGVVEVGDDGVAHVTFQVPDFNGTVRLMAQAWTLHAVGSAEKDVLVRDPIVVSAATPRFLAPQDITRVLLDVAHAAGPAGDVNVTLESDGGLAISGATSHDLVVEEGGIVRVSIPVTAVEIGNPELRIRTRTPGGQELTKTLTIPVRLNDPEVSRRAKIPLASDGRLVIDRNTFAGLEAGTARASLGIGVVAQFDAPGLMLALDRYPYGCTEQITSRALPLLYLDEMARALGMEKRKEIPKRVADAIAGVLENQSSAGSFGLWRAGGDDLWLDAYVTDFLSRARLQGHEVPDNAFQRALDNLGSVLSYRSDFRNGGEDVAYALMVLAREGAASIGDLRYFADAKADEFATPLAKAQLGAALAFYGEQQRADAMFRRAQADLLTPPADPLAWREDFGTRLRDGAAVIALAAEARTAAVDLPRLVNRVADSLPERYTSTQEKAWLLMATRAVMDRVATGLTVDGQPMGLAVRTIRDEDVENDAVVIENTGPATQATLTTFGVPVDPGPAGGNGYAIERTYYTMDGTPVSPASVAQNDRLVVKVTVTPRTKRRARLIIDDPLPAGFEIDNPNLVEAGKTTGLEWLSTSGDVANTEFRTDRFVAAVDGGGSTINLAYIVRAVSPGIFHHPAALVEDMYRPEFRAWTATGTVQVVDVN